MRPLQYGNAGMSGRLFLPNHNRADLLYEYVLVRPGVTLAGLLQAGPAGSCSNHSNQDNCGLLDHSNQDNCGLLSNMRLYRLRYSVYASIAALWSKSAVLTEAGQHADSLECVWSMFAALRPAKLPHTTSASYEDGACWCPPYNAHHTFSWHTIRRMIGYGPILAPVEQCCRPSDQLRCTHRGYRGQCSPRYGPMSRFVFLDRGRLSSAAGPR